MIERGGVKLGVFALTGSDFDKLIKPENRPEGSRFVDGEKVAPAIILHLRQVEKVDAVISIGHRFYEDDVKLAQDVPGIDVILGTHSHRKEDLKQIPGTNTWIISPFQYFEYVSRVELTFEDGNLATVGGGLVRMGPNRPEAPDVAEKVATMQRDLEADPQYAARFERLGQAAVELSDAGISSGESVLGNWVQDTVRAAAGAQVALSTASSFRASIPPGDVTVEDYLTAVPYKNLVLVHEMTGAQLQSLLDLSTSKAGTDSFSQASGVRYAIQDGKATDVQVLASPSGNASGQSSALRAARPRRDVPGCHHRLPGAVRGRRQRPVQAGRERHRHRHHRQRPDDADAAKHQPGQRGAGRPRPLGTAAHPSPRARGEGRRRSSPWSRRAAGWG